MKRKRVFFLVLLLSGLFLSTNAYGLSLASVQAGASFIPDGKIFGAMVKASLGPFFSTYAEFFKKGDHTTTNVGGNFFSLKLPTPKLKPYIDFGGGLNRSSDGDNSKTRLMANVAAGAELALGGKTSLFGQVKYIYTFGSSALIGNDVGRDVVIQAGLSFNLGI